jgi:hypothetical protein
MIGRRVSSVHEHHALEGGGDTETLQDVMHGAAFDDLHRGLAVMAVGGKEAGERREEPDFDGQR